LAVHQSEDQFIAASLMQRIVGGPNRVDAQTNLDDRAPEYGQAFIDAWSGCRPSRVSGTV